MKCQLQEQLLVATITNNTGFVEVSDIVVTVDYEEPAIQFGKYHALTALPFSHISNPSITIHRSYEDSSIFYVYRKFDSVQWVLIDNAPNGSNLTEGQCYRCPEKYVLYSGQRSNDIDNILSMCRQLYINTMQNVTKKSR